MVDESHENEEEEDEDEDQLNFIVKYALHRNLSGKMCSSSTPQPNFTLYRDSSST